MIRVATLDDVPAIHALIRELARYEKLLHEAVATEEQIRGSLFPSAEPVASVGPQAEVLVAEDDAENDPPAVVGFALFFHNYSTFLGRRGLYLEDLFVLPEHRKKGHGTALLRALARTAVTRGCGRFEWAVLHWNEPAIRFYRSLGAEEMREWRIFRVTGPGLVRLAGVAVDTTSPPGIPGDDG
jgi:GNAT superfamily N-acetyltransferase